MQRGEGKLAAAAAAARKADEERDAKEGKAAFDLNEFQGMAGVES